jgi:hypothetical protein
MKNVIGFLSPDGTPAQPPRTSNVAAKLVERIDILLH